MKKTLNIVSVCAGIFFAVGCKLNYSFTGASISPDIKTISIQYFPNHAPLVQPILSQLFTESLKDKFLSETSLSLIDHEGDLTFEGIISGYSVQPIAIQGNETAALNRLTISIKVKFINNKDEKQNFDQTFSRYADYESTLDLAAVEEGLIKDINGQIIQDIFNKAVINW